MNPTMRMNVLDLSLYILHIGTNDQSEESAEESAETIVELVIETTEYLKTQKSNVVVSIQPAITCLKLTIETLEQGVKYVQS